jgi:branched-chain amino acid transport system substrate-binding protein
MSKIAIVLVLALLAGFVAACNGGSQQAGSGRTSIKIGYVGPLSGPQSRFTVGIRQAAERNLKIINEELGGFSIGPYSNLPIEIIWGDSESNEGRAAEVADWLVTSEKVDMLIGQWTPSHGIPVSIAADRHQVPALVLNGPDGSWLQAGPFDWAYGVYFNMESLTREFYHGWNSLDTNRKIGLVFDSSVDGVTQANLLHELSGEFGYEIIDPGRFPADTTDFTAIITEIMNAGCDILATVNGTPALTTIWNTMQQLNYRPKAVLFNRGMHFSADVNQLGGEWGGAGIAWSAQWTGDMPYVSSLSGKNGPELNQLHSEATGEAPDLVVGWDAMIFDVLHDVFNRVESLEPLAIKQALAATDLHSAYGHIKFDSRNLSISPSFMGQWRTDARWGHQPVVASGEYDPALTSVGLIPMPWSLP